MTNAYFFHLVHLTDEFNLKKLGGTQILEIPQLYN